MVISFDQSIMEDTRGAFIKVQSNMKNILGTLTMLIKQYRTYFGSQRATKSLNGIVDKIGRFDRKNIINFLRVKFVRLRCIKYLKPK